MKQTSKNKFAAIDIGSNAIRFILAEYSPLGFRLLKKYRVPIRLGGDVFEKGKISGKNLKASARAFHKMKEILVEHKIKSLRTVGTSALREAKNGQAFVELVHRKSGIKVEIIDGMEEARLIHLAIKKEIHLEKHNCLLIDIGGGSIELTISEMGNTTASQSFPFGTVRTLEKMKAKKLKEEQIRVVIGEYVESISHFLSAKQTATKFEFSVGTGGNLEAIAKLRKILLKKNGKQSLTADELSQIVEKLARMSVSERIEKLKMRPDRADVILPAALLVQAVMRLASIDKILIPGVGLKDGLLWSMTEQTIQAF